VVDDGWHLVRDRGMWGCSDGHHTVTIEATSWTAPTKGNIELTHVTAWDAR
jgi:hypothetical protein